MNTVHHALSLGDKAFIPDDCFVQVKKRHNFMGHFHMSYDFALAKAVTETGEALPTLIRLFTYVKSENQVFVKQSAMAKEFGISRLTFIRHFNRLKELNIVKPDPREGDAIRNIHLWRICPFLIWKGDRAELNAYLNSLPENHPWLMEWKAC